jgi:hypothetical protein
MAIRKKISILQLFQASGGRKWNNLNMKGTNFTSLRNVASNRKVPVTQDLL